MFGRGEGETRGGVGGRVVLDARGRECLVVTAL